MKKYKKLISILALVAIILGILPLSIFASDDIPEIEAPLEPEIKITEVLDRREESIKHFKMPDGTYNAISYAGAVHRKNSDGEWIDINNDLSITTIGSKQLYTTNDSRVTFSRSYSSNEDIMTLRENGYVISMALLSNSNDDDMSMDMNDNASLVTVNNSNYSRPESFDTIDEAIEINNKSSISYSNVMKYTDIEYVMNGNDIKENIIVKDRSDSYIYAFRLSLDGLIPVLDESGAIYLHDEDTEETKYVIPAPYMYDSNDEYSEDVYYELLNVDGDKYLLTVTASSEWINDEERAFPVTVDPSIVYSTGTPIDTYISSTKPMSQHGSSVALWADNTNTALINIPLPSIHTSTNAGIFISADLVINYYGTKAYGTATVEVYRILESWSENTVTYNTRPDMEETRSSYALVAVPEGYNYNNSRVAMLNITNSIKNYYDTGKPFYGIALKIPESENASSQITMRIKSHESGVAYEEYMIVSYNTLDIESGKDYYIQNKDTNTFLQTSENYAPNYDTENADMDLQNLSDGSGNHQKWKFVYLNSGYFKIQSVKSEKVLAVETTNGDPYGIDIVQQAYSGLHRQQWKILKSSHGGYILVPRSSEADDDIWCMVGLGDQSGGYVFQMDYVNDTIYDDEWILAKIGYVSEKVVLEAQEEEVWCWVAVARMFAMHYTSDPIPSDRTQSTAANAIYPNGNSNQPGKVSHTQSAINYYLTGSTNNTNSYVTEGQEYVDEIYPEDVLIQFLADEQILILATVTELRDSNGEPLPEIKHFVLLCGYVIIDSEYYFLILDPYLLENAPYGLPKGGAYFLTYDSLISDRGTTFDRENGAEVFYNTQWIQYIIMVNEKTSVHKESRRSRYLYLPDW